jgi:CheY-like chemotaxis protein
MAKVLIVDDDPSVVRVLQVALEAKGYKTLTACSREEAVTSAVGNSPDLMIVDVMMPKATEGFHLVWDIRQAEGQLADIPIIMLTAIHEDTGPTYGPSKFLPVQEWLGKPVHVEELLEKVAKALGK